MNRMPERRLAAGLNRCLSTGRLRSESNRAGLRQRISRQHAGAPVHGPDSRPVVGGSPMNLPERGTPGEGTGPTSCRPGPLPRRFGFVGTRREHIRLNFFPFKAEREKILRPPGSFAAPYPRASVVSLPVRLCFPCPDETCVAPSMGLRTVGSAHGGSGSPPPRWWT